MVAERGDADYLLGVDTHADEHTIALVERASGRLLGHWQVAASRHGYRQALRLADRHCRGSRLWLVESSGCYGAGLVRFLHAHGEQLAELARPRREGRCGRLKSDAIDAERAARSGLRQRPGAPRAVQGERAALRQLLVAREAAVDVRRRGLGELRALVVTAPEGLRERLRRLGRARLVQACLRLRAGGDCERRACVLALRTTAERVEQASRQARLLEREIASLVRALCPSLLALPGVGPISAGSLLCAWSYPQRLRSEAAFARLAGAAPIPASSGKVVRHRLDRGGDRKLNRALHTIVLTRRRCHAETIAYLERRRAEGRSEREAVRCLKRYLARSLFRLLEREGAALTA